MAQIQVTVADMEDKKAQLTQLLQQFIEEIDNTDQIVDSLRNDWEGEASDAFQDNYKAKAQRLRQASEGLQGYITMLGNIIEAYAQTEAANVQIAGN